MGNDRLGWNPSTVHQSSSDVDVSRLSASLSNGGDVETRRRAATLLGHLNLGKIEADRATVTRTLVEAVVSDDDDRVRKRAVESLYGYGGRYVEELTRALAAAARRGEIGDERGGAAASLAGWLDSEHPELRMVAAGALGVLGDDRADAALRGALGDPDARVRSRAADAYGRLEGSTADPVAPLLDDPYAHVRRSAARSLASIGSTDAVEQLFGAVGDDDDAVRRTAVGSLHRAGTERAGNVLAASLTDPSGEVRGAAARSLLSLVAGEGAIGAAWVRAAVVDDPNVPGADRAVPLVADVLEGSAETELRRAAVEVLGELAAATGRPDARDRLVDALDDGDHDVADAAETALGELDGAEIETPLRHLLRDGDTSAAGRERAERLLDAIRSEAADVLAGKSIEYTYLDRPAEYPVDGRRGTR